MGLGSGLVVCVGGENWNYSDFSASRRASTLTFREEDCVWTEDDEEEVAACAWC